ncbi:sensor histidine kinase [Clostridium lundense]|uniref:sensor histidine kinase n=1 Tax=Clostridium lundense TaxID=319475 RepID=UPI0004867DF4|nr:sensor histidine kinase [Clostridium lundense]
MKLYNYLYDKIYIVLLNVICMVALSFYIGEIGNNYSEIILPLIVWTGILYFTMLVGYFKRKKYLQNLLDIAENLEEKYLIASVMEEPMKVDDVVYQKIIRLSNKSMLEKIAKVKHERKEYKDYIEQWIHEVKTPIAAMKLICENNRSDITRKLLEEVEKSEHFVEQALFYARSENVEKDYIINEIFLSDVVRRAVMDNRQLIINNNVEIKIENCQYTVFTDSKWIQFILNQLISNSIKYKNEDNSILKFYANEISSGIELVIEDNGIGIDECDIPRVFYKGFTGKNGRNREKTTGIGLYLCKRLCDKLGLQINVTSQADLYTRIIISFPKGEFIKVARSRDS